MNMHGLQDKVVIVAGGATGIGAATAVRLAAEGCRVVVGDVADDGAAKTARTIANSGGTATAVGFDISEPDSVRTLVETAVTTYGGVDLLFNVAADMRAVRSDSDAVSIDLDIWDRAMAVNLRGFLLTIREVIPHMLARGGGAVVNMSSAASFLGEPARPAYAAAKAGVNALTRHVASRWGKEGIRCNAVAPGLIVTDTIRGAPQYARLEAAALPAVRSHRLGNPEDAAAMVVFLLSDDAAWVNGQVMSVDGGTVLR